VRIYDTIGDNRLPHLVAVPVMAIMMFIAANPKIMGKFPVSGFLKIVGWTATVRHGSGRRRDGHYGIDEMNGVRFANAKFAPYHAMGQDGRATVLIGAAGLLGLSYLSSLVVAVAQQPSTPSGTTLRQLPLPVPRPSFAPPAPSDLSAQPELIPPQPPAQPTQSTDEDYASNHCLADLKILGAEFMPTASDRLNSRCPVVTPVDITSIKTPAGRVTFPDKPTFRCAFALQFANWLSNVAAPLIRVLAGSDLATVATGPGYVRRTRNGDSSTFAKNKRACHRQCRRHYGARFGRQETDWNFGYRQRTQSGPSTPDGPAAHGLRLLYHRAGTWR
jgi:hypothetical protein